MPSTIGHSLTLSLFGESHGPAVGVVMDGLASGIPLDLGFMAAQMARRQARGPLSTARREEDAVEILSGFYNGHTTGTPLCLLIRNRAQRSADYEEQPFIPRPGHADYAAHVKYLGYEDRRGGGHFSGRLTAPLVAAGAVCLQILAAHGMSVGTHIAQLADLADTPFGPDEDTLSAQFATLRAADFPALSPIAAEKMKSAVAAAKAAGDSVGGILETAVSPMEAGVGEPFFHSVESTLAALLYSVPAVKAVEFGLGFGFAALTGSRANDPLYMQGDQVRTATNHNGGVNGGVTNGMPLIIRTCIKPTPSIALPQRSVDLGKGEDAALTIHGRHDPAILHRAAVVADSVVAFGLVDLFARRWGTQWMGERP